MSFVAEGQSVQRFILGCADSERYNPGPRQRLCQYFGLHSLSSSISKEF